MRKSLVIAQRYPFPFNNLINNYCLFQPMESYWLGGILNSFLGLMLELESLFYQVNTRSHHRLVYKVDLVKIAIKVRAWCRESL